MSRDSSLLAVISAKGGFMTVENRTVRFNKNPMLAKRKVCGKELANAIGITEQNSSLLLTEKLKVCASRALSGFAKCLNVSLETYWNMSQKLDLG